MSAPRASGAARAAVIEGVGACLPARVVGNDEVAAGLQIDDAWIRRRVGIRERRFADPGTASGDLAVQAARLALESCGAEDVDLLVFTSTTPDWANCPATGPSVAARLGLRGSGAFDVSAACSGFLYSAALAAGLIAAGTARRILVVAAETLTTIRDPADRNCAAILADGAGAVVLRAGEPDEPGALGRPALGSDGEHAELLVVPGGGSRQRSSGRPAAARDGYLRMVGKDTYRHAVLRMAECSLTALGFAQWRAAEIDSFAAHQANVRICDAVAERLGVEPAARLGNIERVGNTGAASLPLLLAQSAESGRLRPGHRVLLTAFGSGLTWAATTLTWPDIRALTAMAEPAAA